MCRLLLAGPTSTSPFERAPGEKENMAKRQRGQAKVHKVMSEYKHGELHSGSKKGPRVKSRKQAIAIAMSEAGLSRRK